MPNILMVKIMGGVSSDDINCMAFFLCDALMARLKTCLKLVLMNEMNFELPSHIGAMPMRALFSCICVEVSPNLATFLEIQITCSSCCYGKFIMNCRRAIMGQ
jgi:hypothetical protein